MVYVIMGVSGCGKTTIGKMVAAEKGVPFFDGDNFHPEKNVKKMSQGIPLNDEDRKPWLEILAHQITEWNKLGGAVLACSALKESYRNHLKSQSKYDQVQFIYLKGSKDLISERLHKRSGHYMPADLLDSQFNDLEEPKDAITISVDGEPKTIAHEILKLTDSK